MSDDFEAGNPDAPPLPEPVEKKTRWTEEERSADERLGEERPYWESAFPVGAKFNVNGFISRVLQIGFAGGRWMVLIEPIKPVPQISVPPKPEAKVQEAAEITSLRQSGMGKKAAKAKVRQLRRVK